MLSFCTTFLVNNDLKAKKNIFLNYSLIILFRELTNCHYLASSISVFMPFIFSFRIKFKVCFIFLRDTAAKE